MTLQSTLELCGEGTGWKQKELGEHCHVQPKMLLLRTRPWRRGEDVDAHTSGSGLQGRGEPAGDSGCESLH